jgi:hypothetical protein
MQDWLTIPILPCINVTATLDFWEVLGYTVIYKQVRPYPYGVVERSGYTLHFGYIKGMSAASNSSIGCLVMVHDAASVYQEFANRLKQHTGKVPHSGIPRLSRMKPGVTRFTLTDVSGNSVIFVSYGEQDQEQWEVADDRNQDRLARALAVAKRFRDYKNDDDLAAKTLDVALKDVEGTDPLQIAELLVMRIALSEAMEEEGTLAAYRERLEELGLSENELTIIRQRHRTV